MISIRSIFHSKIVLAIILLLILYIVFLFSDKYARTLQLKEDIKRLESEIEELKVKKELLNWKNNEQILRFDFFYMRNRLIISIENTYYKYNPRRDSNPQSPD